MRRKERKEERKKERSPAALYHVPAKLAILLFLGMSWAGVR